MLHKYISHLDSTHDMEVMFYISLRWEKRSRIMSSYMNGSCAAEPDDAYLQQKWLSPLYIALSLNIYLQVSWTLHEPLKNQR